MVCCGWKDYADLKRHLKKKKHKEWRDALDVKTEEFKSCHFSRWSVENVKTKKTVSYTMLWLIDWKEDVEHFKILAHELVHAVQFCMPDFLDPAKECEAVAYQHSYLFESIVKKLKV